LERSVRSGENATKSFLEAPTILSSPRHEVEGIRIKPNLVTQLATAVRCAIPTADATGKSGLLPWLRPNEYPWTLHFVWKLLHNDPGHLSLLATIRSRIRHLITSGRDSYRYHSPQSAKERGGSANQLANGYPRSQRTILNFIVLLEAMDWAD